MLFRSLIDLLIGAIATPVLAGEDEISCDYADALKSDKGFILHAITCGAVVKFPKKGRS